MDKYVTRTYSAESLTSVGKRPADDDADTWRYPKRHAPPRAQQMKTLNVPVSNRFSNLRFEQSEATSSNFSRVAPEKKTKSPKIPPIVIEIPVDWTHETIKTMILSFTKNFHLAYKGRNKVAVHCYTATSHQEIKDGLITKEVAFHTYSRKDEKLSKVVIRGLPASVESLIPDELASLGYKDASVTKMKCKNTDSPYPPFLIQLPAGTDMTKFRQLKHLCHCVISIQRYKPNSTSGTQCYRCQRFGHAAKNCNLTARCVKCTELHSSKDCPKTDRALPARCCNCNEEHPANYSKCKERVEYLQRTQRSRGTNLTRVNSVPETTKAPPTSQLNYNQAWTNTITTPKQRTYSHVTRHQDPNEFLRKKIGYEDPSQKPDDSTSEMLQILSVIRKIKDQFTTCDSMVDKVILVLTHLGQYI